MTYSAAPAEVFCSRRLEKVFARCFRAPFQTELVGGAREPLYRPARAAAALHRLCYREDFFASALHEVAHWCIAGQARRRRIDFGYWYVGEGRSPGQQRRFEAVEYKPQAMEWFFSRACGWPFRISIDNLDAASDPSASGAFRRRILAQALEWRSSGLPGRAAHFYAALCAEFDTAVPARAQTFSLAELH